MAMTYSVRLENIIDDAIDSKIVSFFIPEKHRAVFHFVPGQYITLWVEIKGIEVRRCYSICSDNDLLNAKGIVQIGCRMIPNGLMSNWFNHEVKPGDKVKLMPPMGHFQILKKKALHRVGFASGSGITPILAIMRETLQSNALSKFTLVYANKHTTTVMFKEALQDLKDRYLDRLTLIYIFSRQQQDNDLFQGRINKEKVNAFLQSLLPLGSLDEVFICGPNDMIESVANTLKEHHLPEDRVRVEYFVAGYTPLALQSKTDESIIQGAQPTNRLKLHLNGKIFELPMLAHETVLQCALRAGLDIPFSCQSGVCCTCMAKLLTGSVDLLKNFTLQKKELSLNYILTCQAVARSDSIEVSFDDR
ncbi:MAG: FAD-binding oxidoreductase [Gammaproteobacteria bacterium]|nr:FAD-binding oxidoreductase [Gammaproteobacteria bacterium]